MRGMGRISNAERDEKHMPLSGASRATAARPCASLLSPRAWPRAQARPGSQSHAHTAIRQTRMSDAWGVRGN
jgi:hypothetical protein